MGKLVSLHRIKIQSRTISAGISYSAVFSKKLRNSVISVPVGGFWVTAMLNTTLRFLGLSYLAVYYTDNWNHV
jgi:hypothetical protein